MPSSSPKDRGPSDRDPLLMQPAQEEDSQNPQHTVPLRVVYRLYLSHFLSTWNSRVFEFGTVLYLATIFPGTLLPMSVYALTRGLSAIIFASAIGRYVDTGDHLQVVRLSIVVQRLVVAASCVVFYILAVHVPLKQGGRTGLLSLLMFLACLEKLCSILNLISVERDWVVVIAQKDEVALRSLNARMRRIDLLCKLFGPLCIALIDGASTEVAIIVNFTMNLTSVLVEYIAIARVYREVPGLQKSKGASSIERADLEPSQEAETWLAHIWRHVKTMLAKSAADFKLYYGHRAFLPSIAGSLIYLTVLNFAGQMVTYLLAAGYSSTQVGIARTLSVAFEVLATWVAPWLMGEIGPVRAGLWLSSWQVIMLVAGNVVFWVFIDTPIISASGLVGGTILSRIGLRGFDLCTQLIIQEARSTDVEAENRGAFSSVEAAWQNAFEILSYGSTIIFFRPDEFKWPALISVVAVTFASSAYYLFVRLRRGHLVHLDVLTKLFASRTGRQREQNRAIERITSNRDT